MKGFGVSYDEVPLINNLDVDFDELKKACEFAHDKSVKIYLTCNTVPRNGEIDVFSTDNSFVKFEYVEIIKD